LYFLPVIGIKHGASSQFKLGVPFRLRLVPDYPKEVFFIFPFLMAFLGKIDFDPSMNLTRWVLFPSFQLGKDDTVGDPSCFSGGKERIFCLVEELLILWKREDFLY